MRPLASAASRGDHPILSRRSPSPHSHSRRTIRMRRLRYAVFPAALVAAWAALAQSPDDPALALDQKIQAQAKAGTDIMANLTYLSDTIGPRLTGSANLKRANEWAAEKMRSYGLE